MTQIKNQTLIYPELSYKLNGIFFRIHNELGRYCKEKEYTDAIEVLLKKENISYKREKMRSKNFLDEEINYGIPDLIIEDKIIVEIKAKKFITKDDYLQTMRYLKNGNYKLGLLVNFRHTYLRPKRIAN